MSPPSPDSRGQPATLICASAPDRGWQRAYLLVWFAGVYPEIIKHAHSRPEGPDHCQSLKDYTGQSLAAYARGHNDPNKFIHTGLGQFKEGYLDVGLDYFSPKIKLLESSGMKVWKSCSNSATTWNF